MGIGVMTKKEKTINRVVMLPIEEIHRNPAQPRKYFEEEQLAVLAQSIAENGLLQPITVRKLGKEYELISGERRLRACEKLQYTQIPAIIIEITERESAVLALIENIHREDLSVFEQAEALKRLILEWQVTQEEAASKLGMAQSTVANKIRLLKFSEEERELILQGNLTERHARALLKIEKASLRRELIQAAIDKKWNVLQLEHQIELMESKKKRGKKVPIIKDVRIFANTLNKAVKLMREAGIPALSEKKEGEAFIEYIVRIPKQ